MIWSGSMRVLKAQISQRSQDITPFHVMDILARAKDLEAQGHDIIHMEVGEPDFTTPQPIIDAGIKALQQGKTHYTPALGLAELRQAISTWYKTRYQLDVAPQRIVITPGASGALLLAMGALVERDHSIMLADPGYPCNRNFARFIEAKSQSIAVDESSNYQLTAEHIERYWQDDTCAALVASPSNPTGTLLSREDLKSLSAAVKQKHGQLIVDEIYHGLTYDGLKAETVLAVNDQAFVINSFSKFFGMTGWRLGWLVVPEPYIKVMDRLAQNLFLAAPTMSQYAALAAFEPHTLALLEQRRTEFEQRRNILIPALKSLGLKINAVPQGAFYIYADCSELLTEHCPNSMALSRYWLEKAGVAVTPGDDFGQHLNSHHLRFAYTVDQTRLLQAVERIKNI